MTVIKILLSFVVKCSLSFALHWGSHVALHNISQISWLQLSPRCNIIIIKNTPVPPPPNLLLFVAYGRVKLYCAAMTKFCVCFRPLVYLHPLLVNMFYTCLTPHPTHNPYDMIYECPLMCHIQVL